MSGGGTWEDVDVDDGQRVRVYVDDDVHAEKRHAELRAELFDQRGHGLGAGRREVGHLFIQLGGEITDSLQVRPSPAFYTAYPALSYRREVRAGLWLGHLMAVEENCLSVWRRRHSD